MRSVRSAVVFFSISETMVRLFPSRAAWLGGLETGEMEIWTNDRYLLAAVVHFGLAGHSV